MRPRSERAHNEVLNAASRLFAERGIDATSMDAIAAASGVSKATIYKHWPDKDALCLEVLSRIHGHDEASPYRLTGDLRSDLLAVLTHEPPAQFAEVRSRITPHLVSYGLRNPAFGKAWRLRVLEPPRTQLTALLGRRAPKGHCRNPSTSTWPLRCSWGRFSIATSCQWWTGPFLPISLKRSSSRF
jgi:AcrR family transcriptional regulator